MPASLAEVVLAATVSLPPKKGWQASLPPGPEVCLEAFEEATGERARACARPDGDALAASVLGAAETIAPGARRLPRRGGRPGAGGPLRARRRGDRAPASRRGSTARGWRAPRIPRSPPPSAACRATRTVDAADLGFLPAPQADGPSCREKTAAWLARAARAGLEGRTAVGVAWDGRRFVWHAWAQVRLERGWIPVDPSFGELPAAGPRFTLATWAEGDAAARLRAGERILACWARERVRER